MATYEVKDAVRSEMVDPASGERFVFEAKAGKHEPKNERDEAALEHLVVMGIAERQGRRETRKRDASADEPKAGARRSTTQTERSQAGSPDPKIPRKRR